MAQPSGGVGLECMLKYYVYNCFINDITDGALRILSGILFQTVDVL